MEKLAKEIVKKWKELRDKCDRYNPQFYRGAPHLTDHWCNSPRNKSPNFGFSLGPCSMSYCPKLPTLV